MKKILFTIIAFLIGSYAFGQANLTYVRSYDSSFAIVDQSFPDDTLWKFTKDGYILKYASNVVVDTLATKGDVQSGDSTFVESTIDTINTFLIYFDTINDGYQNIKGAVHWDTVHNCISVMNGNGSSTELGEELNYFVKNQSGTSISNGDPVYVTASASDEIRVGLASNLDASTAYTSIGIATTDIPNGSTGRSCFIGKVHDVNTSAFSPLDYLYLGDGVIQNTKPTTGHIIVLGIVLRSHPTDGIIGVAPRFNSSSIGFSALTTDGTSGTYIDSTSVTTDSVIAGITQTDKIIGVSDNAYSSYNDGIFNFDDNYIESNVTNSGNYVDYLSAVSGENVNFSIELKNSSITSDLILEYNKLFYSNSIADTIFRASTTEFKTFVPLFTDNIESSGLTITNTSTNDYINLDGSGLQAVTGSTRDITLQSNDEVSIQSVNNITLTTTSGYVNVIADSLYSDTITALKGKFDTIEFANGAQITDTISLKEAVNAEVFDSVNAVIGDFDTIYSDVTYSILPHAALYRNTNLTLTVSLNVWAKITGFTTKDADDITVQGDSIQLTMAGSYDIDFTTSFSGNNGEVWEIGVFKNGVLEEPSQLRYTSTSDVGNMSCPVYVMSDGDDWFSFKIRNTTDADDPTIRRFSVIVRTEHLTP